MICFHHNDLDGRASGAVVNLFREGKAFEECKFIEMEYSKDLPMDIIHPCERIYIVDYHIQNEQEFSKLYSLTQRVTLIDHHKSTVKDRQEHPDLYDSIESIIDERYSGCYLTWQYFSFVHDRQVPEALKLIDDMDRWIWQYGDKTANFCEGMNLYPHQPTDDIWITLLGNIYDDVKETFIQQVIRNGEICNQYSEMISNDYCKSYGFETEFEGYKAFVQGMYRGGSKAFGERIKQYPLCLSFEFTGEKWIIGLYSETIDVSEIAMKHGGGGHKGAAGFVCDELPFRRKICKQ